MPVRIYDIARKLGLESKIVLAKAKELGISHANVRSRTLDKSTAEYLEESVRATLPAVPGATLESVPAPDTGFAESTVAVLEPPLPSVASTPSSTHVEPAMEVDFPAPPAPGGTVAPVETGETVQSPITPASPTPAGPPSAPAQVAPAPPPAAPPPRSQAPRPTSPPVPPSPSPVSPPPAPTFVQAPPPSAPVAAPVPA